MFAANPQLDVRKCLTCPLTGDLHQFANAFDVEIYERVTLDQIPTHVFR